MPKGIFCLPSQKGEKALCWDWRNKGKKEGGGNKGREETRKANRPLREQAEKQTRPLFSSWHSKEVVFHRGGLVSLFVCQSTGSVFFTKINHFSLEQNRNWNQQRTTVVYCQNHPHWYTYKLHGCIKRLLEKKPSRFTTHRLLSGSLGGAWTQRLFNVQWASNIIKGSVSWKYVVNTLKTANLLNTVA